MVAAAEGVDISQHDRYLIYLMLGRHIEVSHRPWKRQKGSNGIVEDVRRNIFESTIEVIINGQLWSFREPPVIVRTNGSINGSVVFVYGDFEPEITDEQLFEEMSSSQEFGENVNDVLFRTQHSSEVRVVEFLLGEKMKNRGKTWRKAV